MTLQELTIRYGLMTGSGGGLATHSGPLTLTKSLVAKNPDGGDCNSFEGSITATGDNLVRHVFVVYQCRKEVMGKVGQQENSRSRV